MKDETANVTQQSNVMQFTSPQLLNTAGIDSARSRRFNRQVNLYEADQQAGRE